MVMWEKVLPLRSPEQAAAFVARPDFYGSELQMVAFVRKPGSAT